MKEPGEDFLRTWFHGADGQKELRHLPSRERSFHSDSESLLRAAKRYTSGHVYFGVATRDGKGGGKENIVAIPGLYSDLDFKLTPREQAEKLLREFPLKPTYCIASGGGWHLYWKFKEPAGKEDIPQVEAILRGIIRALHADPDAKDASRVLRVPGTLNPKYDPPRRVEVIEANPEALYDLSDFAIFEDAEPIRETASSSPAIREVVERCAFLRHCEEDAETLPEPEWYAWISALGRTPGVVDYIHQVSSKYPGYSRRETDQKYLHASNAAGPRTCVAIKTLWDCGRDCGVKSPAVLALKDPVEQEPAKADPLILTLETMNPRTAANLIFDQTPEPPKAIDGLLYQSNLLTIAGPPKAGKSWLALLLMLCLVSGRPFLGYLIPRKYRVLYMYAEGGEYPFKKRLERAIGYFPGLEDDDMERLRLLWTAGRAKIDDPKVQSALTRWTEDSDIIFIDPSYKFIGRGDENSHSDARVIQDVYSRLMAAGKTLVIVHHTRKAGQNDGGVDEVRGAGLAADSDAILILNKKKHGINTKYHLKFNLRHFPEPDEMELIRSGGLFEAADVGHPIASVADMVAVIQEAGGEVLGRDTLRQAIERHTGNSVSLETIKRVIQAAEQVQAIRVFPNPGRGGKTRYVA